MLLHSGLLFISCVNELKCSEPNTQVYGPNAAETPRNEDTSNVHVVTGAGLEGISAKNTPPQVARFSIIDCRNSYCNCCDMIELRNPTKPNQVKPSLCDYLEGKIR